MRLAMAHIDLAKAEATAIGSEVAKVAGLVGAAVAAVFMIVILAVVGLSLWLADWILGSMGWGVLHGVLLLAAIAITCVLVAVGVKGVRLVGALAIGIVLGLIVGVLLALALPNQAYTAIGEQLLPNVEAGVRPLIVGMAIFGIIVLLVGIAVLVRGRASGLQIPAFISAILLGVIIGAISATTLGAQVGAAIGITVGYVTWILLMILDVSRTGIDVEAFKARFMPNRTIETSKETLAWLQSKMPPGTGS
jgi:MFS family permease